MSTEELAATFVGRRDILDKVLRSVSAGRSVVLSGARGLGKSSVLLRLAAEVDPTEWLAVKLPEELYGVGSIDDLWAEVLRNLDHHGKETSLQEIRSVLTARNRKLLILVDNLEILCEQLSGDDERQTLGEIINSDKRITFVASTTLDRDHLTSSCGAFVQSMVWLDLPKLSVEEIEALLTRRAKLDGNDHYCEMLKSQSSRLRALAHFAGGFPRLALLLYRVTAHVDIISVTRQLQRLLDEVTPYYKHKLEILPPQQRRILDTLTKAMAANRSGVIPKEIAEASGLSQNLVSAQLKRLESLGYVQVADSSGRNSFYTLTEPLFSIWYQMRFGRDARQRIDWLVTFLKAWYDSQELSTLARDLEESFVAHLKAGDRDAALSSIQFRGFLLAAMEAVSASDARRGLVRDYVALRSRWAIDRPFVEDLAALASSGNEAPQGRVPSKDIDPFARIEISEADRFFKQGRYAEAVAEYTSALDVEPNLIDVLVRRGQARVELGDRVGAAQDFRRVADLPPKPSEQLSFHLALSAIGRHDEALTFFRRQVKDRPKSRKARVQLAQALLAAKRHEEVLEVIENLRRDFDDASLVPVHATQLLVLGRPGDALAVVDQALEHDSRPRLWFLRARILVELGHKDEGLDSFKKGIKAALTDFAEHKDAGTTALLLEQWNEAEFHLSEASRLVPTAVEPVTKLAELNANQGKTDEALQILDRALERGLPSRLLNVERINVLIKAERWSEAINASTAVLVEDPINEAALDARIQAAIALDQLDGLDADISRLIELRPNMAPLWTQLALARAASGDFVEAEKAIAKAIEIDPDSISIRAVEALVLQSLGRGDDALAVMDHYASKVDGLFELRMYLRLLMAGNRFEDALHYSEKLVTLHPDHDEDWALRATVLGRSGRPVDALAAAERGLNINTRSELLLAIKSLALWEMGDLAAAEEAIAEGVRLFPDSSPLWERRGRIALARSIDGDALRYLERAVELDGGSFSAMLALAKTQTKLNSPLADTTIQRAIDLATSPSEAFQAKAARVIWLIRTNDQSKAMAEWETSVLPILKDETDLSDVEAALNEIARLAQPANTVRMIRAANLSEQMLPLVYALNHLTTGDMGPVRRLPPELRGVTQELIDDLRSFHRAAPSVVSAASKRQRSGPPATRNRAKKATH